MKQKKLNRLLMLTLALLTMCVTQVWGEQYSFTIVPSDFNTTSYAANNNSKTSTATSTTNPQKTMDVSWTSNQVMQSQNVIQFQKNAGYIYNTTPLGTINSVTVNSSAGSYSKFFGSSSYPTSGTTVGNKYFTVKVSNTETGKVTSIVVTFTVEDAAPALATPTGLTVGSITATTATLSWNSVANAGSYKVEYKVNGASSWTAVEPNPTTTSCTLSGLTPSTTYAWQVTALPSSSSYSSSAAASGTNFTTAAPAQHTVYWSINGNTDLHNDFAEGAAITFPAEKPDDINGKKFRGWTASPIAGTQAEAPTYVTEATMGGSDITYYAVFATESGQGGETTHTLTVSDLSSWSGYQEGTKSDDQGATWSYYASCSNSAGTIYLGLNSNANNYNVGSPEFSSEVKSITVNVKNNSGSASRTIYICSNNETAQPSSGDIAEEEVAKSFDGQKTISISTPGVTQFYIYTSAALAFTSFSATISSASYSDYCTTVGAVYTVSAVANDGELGGVSVTGKVITATPNECVGYEATAYTVTSGTATVAQEGNTFTVTPTSDCTVQINFVATAEDTYIDDVQDWTASVRYCGSYSAPSITDKTQATSGTCEEVHYHFVGWTTSEYRNRPDGHITTAGMDMTGNGTTYYAVWAKEE